MLISSIAFKSGWIEPIHSLEWLGSTWALVIFSVAAVFETLAFMMPWLDHAFDVIAAPLAVVAGAVLASAVLKDMPPTLQFGLGIIAGGGTAGAVQATTSLLRLGSTKFTGGLGNPFFAKIETGIAFLGSFVAIFLPLMMIVALIVFFILAYKLIRKFVLRNQQNLRGKL